MRLAFIMTCHNRRPTTLECLRALFRQVCEHSIFVYLVDDGCTDGTSEAVKEEFSSVRIIKGDGNLYWSGGMRVAWSDSLIDGYDAYIWLNDDVKLMMGAVNMLADCYLECARDIGRDVIVVGRTVSPNTEVTTYGGLVRVQGFSKLRFRPLLEGETHCDTMNGNCVFIPQCLADDLGNISMCFSHALGDIDYGLRARQAGVTIIECKTPVAELALNPAGYSSIPRVRNIFEFWRVLVHPKGIPVSEWFIFCVRHGGVLWPVNFVARYLRVALQMAKAPSCTK